MPPKKSAEPSEAEIIFARASVALAKNQRLIASWLPPKSEEETARESSNGTEGEDDDDRLETGNGLYVIPPPSLPPLQDPITSFSALLGFVLFSELTMNTG